MRFAIQVIDDLNNDAQLLVNVITFNGIKVERYDWAGRDMLTMLVAFIINGLFRVHEVSNEPLYMYI
ncbi:hypothetical protein [Vulcanisaeta souniana]|uniref:hypothetical protein n=1 Tax=Vulcanisaeta souniana TaxID=164452 RepID=UPI000B127AAA|nr:hypothetical protein [Vulcanisaeta souniana]